MRRICVLLSCTLLAVGCAHTTKTGDKSKDLAAQAVRLGNAENVMPARLGLARARELAFARNWDLLAALSNIDQAEAQKVIAKEFPNPTVSLSVSGISKSLDTALAVSQLIELGGKRGTRIRSAQAGIEAARAQFLDARRLLDAGVTKAYAAALLAGSNVQILRDSAESLRKEAQIAEVREKAGDISVADKLQIELAADRFEADMKSAEAAARTARLQVEILLGIKDPKGDWAPTDTLEQLAAAAPPDKEGAKIRPDLVAAEAALKKAESDLRLQKKSLIPDLTFGLGFDHQSGVNSLSPSVSFPIPLWNRFRGEIRSAEVTRNDAIRAINRIRAQIAADRAQARTTYQDALERWRNYRTIIEPKAERVRQTVFFAYEKGGASLLDLLSAQRTNNDVRTSTVQAASDTISAAADLAAAFNAPMNPDDKKE